MEFFLNLLWLAMAASAPLIAPRRSTRVLLALGCALIVLFPIISVSDDGLADRNSVEEALGIAVKAVVLLISLVAVARVESIRPRHAAFVPIASSDPRSPPRG